MKRRIHVNQHNIRANHKAGNDDLPVISVKTYKDNLYGRIIEIVGPCRVIYRPDKPLPCGARVWIETESDVSIIE